MEPNNPGVLKKNLFFFLIIFAAHFLKAQEKSDPIVIFSHPTLTNVNRLVNSLEYQKAIDLSLAKAQQMKRERNWEGYITFMLRAAEIETFEVWKAKGYPKIKIKPDYRRPLSYLDSLYKNSGTYLDSYPYLKANALFTRAVVYSWLQMPDTSESLHKQAMQLRTNLFGATSREVADSYLWMGNLYNWGLRRRDEAKRNYMEAQELQKKYMPESRYALGSTYYGLASIARENFEFDEAAALAKQYSSLYFDLPYEQAFTLQLFANIYWDQKDYEKSLADRIRSIKILEASGFSENLIIEYGNLSNDLKELGRLDEAKEALQKALKISEKSEIINPLHTKYLYENLGDLYRAMGKYDSAELFFDKALRIAIAEYGKKNAEVADVYGLRGQLHIDRKQFKSGLTDFQQMLISVVPDFHPNDIFVIPKVEHENPYFSIIVKALFNKGDAFLTWYNQDKNLDYLKLALNHYRAAYSQLMIARKTIGDELSKPFLMLNFANSIEKSIQCARILYVKTNQPNFFQDIFHFIELTKYLNVLDALQRAERANNSGIPKSLLFELEAVKNKLNEYQKAILSEQISKDSIARLDEKVLNLINRRRELMAEMSRYPDQKASDLNTMLTNVNDIQLRLSNDAQILEFFWGTDSIYTISITSKTTEVLTVKRTSERDSLFSTVYGLMSRNDNPLDQQQVKNYSEATSRIYKEFFEPLIKMKKLTIIPDGPLSLLSTEALVVAHKPEKKSYSELDYLIHHHEISYAYSASILFRNSVKNVKGIENVLAFSYSSGWGGPSLAQRSGQAELPGTYKELETLSRLFKNVMRFTDQDASKFNFVSNIVGHDIIHLGVHGIGDQEVTDNSRLIFRKDSLSDGALYAYEIYNLNMDAHLVVLSACESGTGRNQVGEGMFSIARAFTYAGCPSIVMSLWKARDGFTSEIMTGFYENLNENESVSSALRNAKLKFLREADTHTGHPANWAPFVVNGQDVAFKTRSGYQYLLIIIAAALATAIIFVYMKKRS